MKRYLVRLAAILFLLLVLPGAACMQAALPVLTEIASVLLNAQNELARVDHYVREYMRASNAPQDVRDKYARIYDAVVRGMNAANSATMGAADLTQEQYDSAFAEFLRAWDELEAFLRETGALSASGKLGGPAGVEMPKPIAKGYKVAP